MTEQILTPEWLMKHGFEWLTDENIPPAFDVTVKADNANVRLLIEKGIHRNQFCIVLEQDNSDGSVYYETAIWMQHNIGCGFDQIPDPIISQWTVERFCALYLALRGEKIVPQTDVFETICAMLEANGFHKKPSGEMIRASTGCSFPYESLAKYKTVTDFQLDWPYSMP